MSPDNDSPTADLEVAAQLHCPTCGTVMADHPRGFMCWTCRVVVTG